MPNDTQAIQSLVIEVVEQTLNDLDLDCDEPLHDGTRLIADLGFASVDFVHLIVEMEERLKRKVGFHELLMPNGRYVDDLTIGDFVAFVDSRLSDAPVAAQAVPSSETLPEDGAKPAEPPLVESDVAEFRALLPSIDQWGQFETPAARNPRMVFLLSSSRSGSTLLRVMLAGNERLFSPPELHLLYFTTMEHRRQALANEWNDHLLTAPIQALATARGCPIEDAADFVHAVERAAMPTHEFYAALIRELDGKLLVDKTPTYAMSLDVLRLAERDFDEPLYIHLVRHPCGMIRSFQDGKLDQLTPFMRNSRFSRRQLGELSWLITNDNISRFLAEIPPERQMCLRYEDLVRDTAGSITSLCRLLDVPFAEQMLNPYENPESRMSVGAQSISEFSGDLKFHLHAGIDPDAADRWRKYDSEENLGEMTRALARAFGY